MDEKCENKDDPFFKFKSNHRNFCFDFSKEDYLYLIFSKKCSANVYFC